MSEPDAQEGRYTKSIQAGGDVVEDDSPAAGKALEAAHGKWFGYIEEAEEDEGDEAVLPIGGAEQQSDPLAGDFIDDDALGIVAIAFALDDGGGGNSKEESEEDSDEQGDEKNARAGMGEPGECAPEKDGSDGAPGAGAGLDEANAEKGCDGPPGLRGVFDE